MKKKVFITGIAGCVGHYLYDLLIDNPDYELYLLIRHPEKMMRDFSKAHLIQDDMRNINKYSPLLSEMEFVVHMVVGWGLGETNYDYTINLFNLLNPARCKKVIYFSTASILDENNNPVEEAEKSGTSYIRSKYLCYKKLPELEIYDRIATVFPTWVLGGDDQHPYSHATAGILKAIKWLNLIRFLNFDLKFHFIHAQDIALIVENLLKRDRLDKNYVLGNELISIGEFVGRLCEYFHKKIYFQVKIKPSFVRFAASVFGKELSQWDKFCLERKVFEQRVVSAKDFGIQSTFMTVEGILRDLARVCKD